MVWGKDRQEVCLGAEATEIPDVRLGLSRTNFISCQHR